MHESLLSGTLLPTFGVLRSFSVRAFIDSCKALNEGEIGHLTRPSACAFSIIDHGEVNTVIGVDPFYPHSQPRSVLKTLTFFDFDTTESLHPPTLGCLGS